MKRLTLMTLLMVATAFSAAAGEKDLPPGLQKKDKLPPGIAKKRGAVDDEHARVVTNTVFVTNVVTTPSAPAPSVAKPATAPAAPPVKIDLEQRAKSINTLDNKAVARRAAFAAIARETGVTVETLQTQHQQHDKIGTAGLAIANIVAAKTKKSPGTYLRQREDGKSLERIATDNGVTPAELDAKLARIEAAMHSAK